MGIYLSSPKTEKFSEDSDNDHLRYGLSSMQGWRAAMEDAHAAYPDLDKSTSFFGVYDGHGGKVVVKFCAKYLHQQVLKSEAYTAGDLGASLQKAFFRCGTALSKGKTDTPYCTIPRGAPRNEGRVLVVARYSSIQQTCRQGYVFGSRHA